MSSTYLRDAGGKILGYIKEQGGMQRLYSRGGKVLGWYNPRGNTTHNADGKIIARCNILVSLLKE